MADLKDIGTGRVQSVQHTVDGPAVCVHHDGESASMTHCYPVSTGFALVLTSAHWIGQRVMIRTRIGVDARSPDALELELLPADAEVESPASIAALRRAHQELTAELAKVRARAPMGTPLLTEQRNLTDSLHRSLVTATNERDSLSAQCFNLRNTVTGLTRDNDALHRAIAKIRGALP
jgi:hypothetical protein